MPRKLQIMGKFPSDGGGDGLSAYEIAKKNGFEGTEAEWLESLRGPEGEDGVTPEFSIGTVETLEAGSNATASIGGTPEKPVLNLGIPRGETDSSSSENVNIDTTLTVEGAAADAKAVGDKFKELSTQNPDLTGAVKSVNGVTPDENGNVEIGFSVETGYLNNTAAGLLISILQTAMFTTDQSANITALKNALALKETSGTTSGSGGSSGGGDTDTTVAFTWVAGTTENAGDWSANNAESKTRLTPYKTNGVFATKIITDANAKYVFDGDFRGQLYLPVIPSGATTLNTNASNIKEFIPNFAVAPAIFSADGTRIADPGYSASTIDLTAYPDAVYYGANAKKNDGSAFTAEEYAWISEYLPDFVFT